MIVRHFIVFLALATQVAVGSAGGLAYLCKMDGEVRSACCCPVHPAEQAGGALLAEGCCEILSAARQEPVEGELRIDAPTPAVGLAAVPVQARAHHPLIVLEPRPEDPLAAGPPLFLRIRTLLI